LSLFSSYHFLSPLFSSLSLPLSNNVVSLFHSSLSSFSLFFSRISFIPLPWYL
jgi:hypothetical protein